MRELLAPCVVLLVGACAARPGKTLPPAPRPADTSAAPPASPSPGASAAVPPELRRWGLTVDAPPASLTIDPREDDALRVEVSPRFRVWVMRSDTSFNRDAAMRSTVHGLTQGGYQIDEHLDARWLGEMARVVRTSKGGVTVFRAFATKARCLYTASYEVDAADDALQLDAFLAALESIGVSGDGLCFQRPRED